MTTFTEREEVGLRETAQLLGESKEELLRIARDFALKRDLETLTEAADIGRRKQKSSNPKEVYWGERLERAAGELMLLIVPDQSEWAEKAS